MQPLFLTLSHFLKQSPHTMGVVAGRRVFDKNLGQFFRELREQRSLGLRQAVQLAEQRELSGLNLNTLGALERGATKNADPELLRAVAAMYKVPYAEVVSGYMTQRYRLRDSDLPRHLEAASRPTINARLPGRRKLLRPLRHDKHAAATRAEEAP